jgi:phosphoheptose isomerase
MHFDDYSNLIKNAHDSVDKLQLKGASMMINRAIKRGIPILTMGNGGSAAIAEHVAADMIKCVKVARPYYKPLVHSLVSNVPLTMAISNDIGYEDVFAKQIEWFPSNALVLAITSSGSSPNIVAGLKAAEYKSYDTIALVGFDGGIILKEDLADTIVHVNSNNYGIVENTHDAILHYIASEIISGF